MIALKAILITITLGIMVSCSPTNVEIIGGHETTIEENPWMVTIYIKYDPLFFECSGSLISPSWIMTAAHCADPAYLPDSYVIGIGSNYSHIDNNSYEVAKIVVHPNYTTTVDHNPLNDIALFNLKTPVDSSIATPVGLPKPFASVVPGSKINITGWGLVASGQDARRLNTITLPLITLEACIDAFRGDSLFINETFCVGKYKDYKGVCNGDSGGPASVNGVAVGITSWTMFGCADQGFPSVFTNISTYRNWIHDVTNV